MLFYKKIISVKQNKSIVFEYLLRREYLKKFFPESKDEKVEIITETENPFLTKGEKFEMIVIDKETIITFQFEVLEITKNELIEIKFSFLKIIDREEGTLDDDLEASKFLKKYIGTDFFYIIELNGGKGSIEIVEYGSVNAFGMLTKIFLKVWDFITN